MRTEEKECVHLFYLEFSFESKPHEIRGEYAGKCRDRVLCGMLRILVDTLPHSF